tara:strand:- start:78 stop:341 length:264 start_codon:yes stop_codon:yes gene_type:complete
VKSVLKRISEPKAQPRAILSTPAIEIITLLVVSDFAEATKGADTTIVNSAIEIIVPIENNKRNRIPVMKLGVVGRIASITAALPARP